MHEMVRADLIAHRSRDPARIIEALVTRGAMLVRAIVEPIQHENAVGIGREAIHKPVNFSETRSFDTEPFAFACGYGVSIGNHCEIFSQ